MVDTAAVRSDVERLLYRYAAAADELDVDTVADLFEYASVDFAGRTARGRTDVHGLFTEVFAGAPRVKHLVSNLLIEISTQPGAETASAHCTYTRWPLEPAMPLGLGEYSATFAVHAGRWRFESFAVRRLWSRLPSAAPTPSTT